MEINENDEIIGKINNVQSANEMLGYVIPYFKKENKTLQVINSLRETFPNAGHIFITANANKLSENSFYKFEVKENTDIGTDPSKCMWIARAVTNPRPISLLEHFAWLMEGHYPDPLDDAGMNYSSISQPEDGIFIRCKNKDNEEVIVGPFALAQSSIKYDLEAAQWNFQIEPFNARTMLPPFHGLRNNPFTVCEIRLDEIPNEIIVTHETLKNTKSTFLLNLNSLQHIAYSLIDMSRPKQIMSWVKKEIRRSENKEFPNESAEQLNKIIKLVSSDSFDIKGIDQRVLDQKKSKFKSVLKNVIKDEKGGDLQPIILDILKSNDGHEIISDYVGKNRDELLKEFEKNNLKKAEIQIQEKIDKQTYALTRKNEELDQAIEEKKEELAQLSNKTSEVDNVDQQKFNEKIKTLTEEKNDLRKKIGEKEEFDSLKENIIREKKRAEDLKNTNRELEKIVRQSGDELRSKLISVKAELDALQNPDSQNLKFTNIIKNLGDDDPIGDVKSVNQIDIISGVEQYLTENGRKIEFEDVSILLTCLIQNLVITLSGKPGSGKSSLVHNIADVLSLKSKYKYIQIQTQKGWTSDKDILGFQNILMGRYEPDRFGLYKLIYAMQNGKDLEDQLALVLLDEANLSPIEHYWSIFMDSIENKDSFRTQGKELKLPAGLRFIATINNDATTELLSPRFIDRSPVIKIENSQFDLTSDEGVGANNSIKSKDYSWELLKNSFEGDNSLDGDIQKFFNKLREYNVFSLETRKVKMVRAFVSAISRVLKQSRENSTNEALDYSLMIFLLPQINGQGSLYREKLEKLKDHLKVNNFRRSTSFVDQIIDSGKNSYETYSYFS